MKVKVKFDLKAIQAFLLQNVEKIGLAVVVCIFFFMVYSAVTGGPSFQKTPAQLNQAIEQGKRKLRETDPNQVLIELTGLDRDAYNQTYAEGYGKKTGDEYIARAAQSQSPIAEKPYVLNRPIDEPLVETRGLRPQPPLLAAKDLCGKAELGAVQETQEIKPADPAAADPDKPAGQDPGAAGPGMGMGPMAGGALTKGERWIVLTALVPIEKQTQAYNEVYKATQGHDATRDVPAYRGYYVERVEVASPAEAANPDWKNAKSWNSVKAVREAARKWQSGVEVVATEYLHERLVFPLPPLMGRPWGDSVGHPPEIPIQKFGAMGPGMGPIGPGMGPLEPGMGPGMRPGMRPGMGPGMRPGMGPGGLRGPGSGAAPSKEDPFDNGNPGGPDAGAGAVNDLPKAPDYLLLRFFDFTVEPGKQYVYRVQLALENPNFGLKAAWLKDPKMADDVNVMSPWSDPSPAISVPRETRALLASVKPAGREPTATVLVAKWSENEGKELHKEFSQVGRGQILNFPKVKVKSTGAPGGMPGMGMPGMGMPGMGMGGVVPGISPEPGAGGAAGGPPDRTRPGDNRRPARGRGNNPDGGAGAAPGGGGRNPPAGNRGRGGRQPGGMPPDPMGGMMPGDPNMGRPMPPPDAGNEIEVDFVTDMTAIDFRGGERLVSKHGNFIELRAAGEMLLLDSDGSLVVRNDLEDQTDREELTKPDANAAIPGAANPINPMGGGLGDLEPPKAPKRPKK
jgi:hypothetical protein